MSPKLVLTVVGAGLLVAGLLALCLEWIPFNQPAKPTDEPTTNHYSVLDSADSSVAEVKRDPVPSGDKPKDPNLRYWRDVPDLANLFASRLFKTQYEDGGDSFMTEYIIRLFEERRDLEPGKVVASLLAKFEDAEMLTPPPAEWTFTGIYFGADAEAGNYLTSQLTHQLEYQRHKERSGYTLPIREMKFDPLAFPPEMFVRHFVPDIALDEIKVAVWSDLGEARDRALNGYLELFQEN